MARSLLAGLMLCGLLLAVNTAEAGRFRRGGCSGGSCGVTYSTGCAGGSCNVQAPWQAPAKPVSPSDVPPAPAAATEAPAAAPVVAVEAAPRATTVAVNTNTRNVRVRVFGRRR